MDNIDEPNKWEDLNYIKSWIVPWHLAMMEYAYETAAVSPNYRYYIAAGTYHTILRENKFYTEESAGGVSFAGWVKKMIKTPNKWENLECEVCYP